MPIEIRELIIKTQISTSDRNTPAAIKEKDLNLLKKQVLEECKRIISESAERNSYKR
jgi:hypothetical protein